MQDYESKQVAVWGFALAAILAIGGVLVAALDGFSGATSFTGVALVLVALMISNFATLTVRVDDREVRWFFGRGPFGRRIELRKVFEAEARRSAWYWGWGIRWTPRGWLWRSSGLDAVWLQLASGKQVGVGTDDPGGLERAIRDRL